MFKEEIHALLLRKSYQVNDVKAFLKPVGCREREAERGNLDRPPKSVNNAHKVAIGETGPVSRGPAQDQHDEHPRSIHFQAIIRLRLINTK